MKKSILLAMFLAPAALFADPAVERVTICQQWPWSTDVKVEYTLSGVDASHPVDIRVRVFNGDEAAPAAAVMAAISGVVTGVTNSTGSFTINPAVAFGSSKNALGSFRVELSISPSAAN